MVTVVDLKRATDLEAAGAHEISVSPGVRLVAMALDPSTTVSLRAGTSGLLLLGGKHDGEIDAAGEKSVFGKRSLVIIGANEEVTVRNCGDELLRFAKLELVSTSELVLAAAEPSTSSAQVAERGSPGAIRVALDAARSALSTPVGDPREWSSAMEAAIENLSAMFAEHVRCDEAPHGFLEESAEEAPRLIHALDRLRLAHAEILDDLGEARARLVAAVSEDAIAGLVPSLAGLIGRIDHHLAVTDRLAIDVVLEATGQGD